MDTKQKIREAALTLFNQGGVDNITTRDIASHIAISQGNLHYHYPNKDAVIEALYRDFVAEIVKAERYSGQGMTRTDMLASMQDGFSIMYQYRFLTIDREIIWRRNPQLKVEFQALIEQKRQQILQIIEHFRKTGVFRTNLTDAQYHSLADHLVFLISSWLHALPFHPPKQNPGHFFALQAFRLWLPYLSESEVELWEAVCKD